MCRAALLLAGLAAVPAIGATVLQCVPYARIVSGVELYGDALTWWGQAEDNYKRGPKPKKGAVLAFRPNGPMVLGHVAVVSKILGDRRILIRHANWSAPGAIEEDVLAIDVSPDGDWSQVRIWFSPNAQMGARTNPTYGFIYPAKAKLRKFTPDPALGGSTRFAKVDEDMWDETDLPDPLRDKRAKPSRARREMVALAEAPTRMPAGARRKTEKADPFIVEYAGKRVDYADNSPRERSIGDIIADVKREARLR